MKELSQDKLENLIRVVKNKKNLIGQIMSGSMEPLLLVGDQIEIFPCQFSELKKFDIIVFGAGKILVCHYVWHINRKSWGKKSTSLVTRSLKGRGEDFPITENEIVGIVKKLKIPLSTKISLIVRSWWANR